MERKRTLKDLLIDHKLVSEFRNIYPRENLKEGVVYNTDVIDISNELSRILTDIGAGDLITAPGGDEDPFEDTHFEANGSSLLEIYQRLEGKKGIIKSQTLERIARHFRSIRTGGTIIDLFKEWGVPASLINYPNTKWWTVFEVLHYYSNSPEKEDHEMLFKIIAEILHPLMYGGNKDEAKRVATDFNTLLEFDGLTAIYDETDRKYFVMKLKDIRRISVEDEPALLDEINQDFFEQEQDELEILRKQENVEKISTLRKAYQALINIAEVFCSNPSRPSHDLNDAYVKTKKMVIDSVISLGLNNDSRIHKLTNYFIPFTNLFSAEKEYTLDILELDLGRKLHWDYIRPRMHATYGEIDEIYRTIDGSDILTKPDVQQTLNDVSLLLSKTKKENEKTLPTRHKTTVKNPPIHQIAITSMPTLRLRGEKVAKISKEFPLKGKAVEFDETGPSIIISSKACPLPPAKNEEYLAKVMFVRRLGEYVDWSIIYREMSGFDSGMKSDEEIGSKENEKSVRDTMDRLNKRIMDFVPTSDELFSWKNKSICRNY